MSTMRQSNSGRLLVFAGVLMLVSILLVKCGDESPAGDTTRPEVISVNPVADASAVAVSAHIQVIFSEAIDPATLTSSSFTLKQGSNPVSGNVSYSRQTGTFTPDSDLEFNTTYTASVSNTIADQAGNRLTNVFQWSFTTEVEAGNPPDAPSSLTITIGDSELSLDWANVSGATSYNLYWSETSGVSRESGNKLTTVTAPYLHSGLTNDTTYYYVVTAVNEFGESIESDEVSGTPQADATPPMPPSNLSATASVAMVKLDWDLRAEASSYNIYWSTQSGVDSANGTQISVNAPPYEHTGLSNNTTYYYVVTAVNEFGESAESVTVSATPSESLQVPQAPESVVATPHDKEVTISFDSVSNADAYHIYWSLSSDFTLLEANKIQNVTSPYNHSNLTNDTTYYYRVTAENAQGESEPSSQVFATPTAATLDAPTGLSALTGDRKISLSWNPVNGASSYNLYWSTETGVTPNSGAQIPSAQSPYDHTDLENGTKYYYVVTAVGEAGESAPSAEASATPLPPLPDAPLGVAAVAGTQQVTLSWEPVAGATAYNLYWRTNSPVNPDNGTKLSSVVSPYEHTNLIAQTTYFYVVTAVNLAGQGPASSEVSATPTPPAPDAPTNVVVESGDGQVTIAWDSVVAATSYNIYWSLNPALSPAIGSKITGATSPHIHLGPTNSYTYYYVVTAENQYGESLASQLASCTPHALDTTHPSVTGNHPQDSALGVAVASPISVVFSEPMDPTSLTDTSFTIQADQVVAGTVSFDDLTATFTPTVALDYATSYTATVTSSARDLAGNNLVSNHSWTFTTQPSAPTNLSSIAGNNEATLTWDPKDGAIEYLIYRAATSGGPYSIRAQVDGPSFTDRNLSNDSTPYYYVITVMTAEGESPYSSQTSVLPMGSLLRAPTNLSATARNGQVSLTWDEVSGDVDYRILRSETRGGPYTEVALVDLSEAYTDRGLSNATTFYYVVQTVAGVLDGAYSQEVSSMTNASLPVAPTSLAAVAGSTWAALDWEAVADSDRYVLLRSVTSQGPYQFVAQPDGIAYNDTQLTNDTTYYFVVAAINASGVGAFSSEISLTPASNLAPQKPVLTTQRGDGRVRLNWTSAAGATSYRVLRGTTPGGPYDDLGVQTPIFVDDTVSNGTTYYYVVRALSAGLTATDSSESPVTPSATPPPAPTGLAAHYGNGRVTLTWNPVNDAMDYGWCVSEVPGGPYSCQCCGWNALVAVHDTGVVNGQNYYYVVQARLADSVYSGYSAEVSASPSSLLPDIPGGPYIHGGNTQLSLTWDAVSGATGYRVHRRTSQTGWAQVANIKQGPYLDTGLTNTTRYYYRVQAENENGTGAWSTSEQSGQTTAKSPQAPLGVKAYAGTGRITLTWDPVIGAQDYGWCVSETSGGPYSCQCCGWNELLAEHTSGVTNGQNYYYTVLARDSDSNYSVLSQEVVAAKATNLPGIPEGPYLSGGKAELSVTWGKVSGATGYRVQRRTADSGWSEVGAVSVGPYLDQGLTNDTLYYYRVQAENGNGTGAWSSGQQSAWVRAESPAPPTSLVAYAGKGRITLTWNPSSGAQDYAWCVATTPGGPYSCQCCGWNELLADHTGGITNGQTYYYTAMARAPESHYSIYADEIAVIPSSSLPDIPQSPSVQGGNSMLSLTWPPVSGATGYRIHRRTADSGWLELGAVTAGPFYDIGLQNETEYFYRIQAENASGTGAWSTPTQSGTTSADKPLPPKGLQAHASNASITLTWDPTNKTQDYGWCVSETPGGPYSCQCCGWTDLIAEQSGLNNGQTYYYVISARNASGDTSALSAEFSATPSSALPSKPGTPAILVGSGQLTLSWVEASGATSYRLYRRTSDTGWALVAQTAATAFIDTGLTSSMTYHYSLVALNGAGTGAWSPVSSATPN